MKIKKFAMLSKELYSLKKVLFTISVKGITNNKVNGNS